MYVGVGKDFFLFLLIVFVAVGGVDGVIVVGCLLFLFCFFLLKYIYLAASVI